MLQQQLKLMEALTVKLSNSSMGQSSAAGGSQSVDHIAGSITEFLYDSQAHITFDSWYKRYEDLFSVDLAAQDDAWKVLDVDVMIVRPSDPPTLALGTVFDCALPKWPITLPKRSLSTEYGRGRSLHLLIDWGPVNHDSGSSRLTLLSSLARISTSSNLNVWPDLVEGATTWELASFLRTAAACSAIRVRSSLPVSPMKSLCLKLPQTQNSRHSKCNNPR
nr:unnamed protein product [Spirometra erinaceieuropaei]